MADTQIEWGGLILGGNTDYPITEITGWEDLSDVSDLSQDRMRGHGEHPGDMFSGARIVVVEGEIVDSVDRDALVRALRAATPVSSVVADLSVTLFGERLTVGARVHRRALKITPGYDLGSVPFALQWRCPDPLRYGAPITPTPSTGLPTSGGGLVYPLTYPLGYGTAGDSGRLIVANPGTAPAPIVFTVTGPFPLGFELSAAGMRLTYPAEVPAGQPVAIDTGSGSVTVEGGTADRRGNLTVADWMQVPPGGSLTVQFTSLGGAYDAAAGVTAAVRPAYW